MIPLPNRLTFAPSHTTWSTFAGSATHFTWDDCGAPAGDRQILVTLPARGRGDPPTVDHLDGLSVVFENGEVP